MKRFILSLVISVVLLPAFAQLKSPEDFLGYKLGSRFTPHHKIAAYFEYVAQNSKYIKLEKYGETWEERPLYLAIATSTINLQNIEEIRQNNLRIAGFAQDKPSVSNNIPIVWLSYNVHGNEASSSEVSMQVVYMLASGTDPEINGWLDKTVVIIDPCLNPDGRDRYVNWYNSVVGQLANVDDFAREHKEPWPAGRSNHYLFDLNRDWAWQTQIETQQRIKAYQRWMPQIHADFHEQMPGNPYYFAPAAEPFHKAITEWQRASQNQIGRNHAKYFDENGWLYFTREYFDLFYPSYGDTYPLFNGSIGMTYEQAGHGRAGLSIKVNQYDTLRLSDRIAHHFTTSMSTVEYAAKNGAKLQAEFKTFYDNSKQNKGGAFKSYVFKNDGTGKTASLLKLLQKNQIQYGFADKNQFAKGYNYFSQKEENFALKPNDIVVPTNQSASVLLNVLMDPSPILSDSATYDITAWALPYAYDIEALATKEAISYKVSSTPTIAKSLNADSYGYVVKYNSFESVQLMTDLLKAGIRLRFSEKGFAQNNHSASTGAFFVLKGDNSGKINRFIQLVNKYRVDVTAITSGFSDNGFDMGSDKVHAITSPKVMMLVGEGVSSLNVGEIWHFFDEELKYPITLVNVDDFSANLLKSYDVLILPDGRFSTVSDKDASSELKSWVNGGGKIIALENAVKEMEKGGWGITLKKSAEDSIKDYDLLKKYGDRERDYLAENIPGAIYKVEMDKSHPLAFGYDQHYFTLKTNSNILEFSKSMWNVGVLKKVKPVSGFVGSKLVGNLKDGTLIGVQQMGGGNIVYFVDNPIFRSFWEGGKLLMSNAVFLLGN